MYYDCMAWLVTCLLRGVYTTGLYWTALITVPWNVENQCKIRLILKLQENSPHHNIHFKQPISMKSSSEHRSVVVVRKLQSICQLRPSDRQTIFCEASVWNRFCISYLRMCTLHHAVPHKATEQQSNSTRRHGDCEPELTATISRHGHLPSTPPEQRGRGCKEIKMVAFTLLPIKHVIYCWSSSNTDVQMTWPRM